MDKEFKPNIINKEEFLQQENKKKFDAIEVGFSASYKRDANSEIDFDWIVKSKNEDDMTVALEKPTQKLNNSSTYRTEVTANMDQVLDVYKPKE